MSVRRERRRDPSTGRERQFWMVDVCIESPDGSRQRVRKVSPVQSRRGAERYERDLRWELLWGRRDAGGGDEESKETPTVAEFAPEFLTDYAEVNNKPSEVHSKESCLRVHLVPWFGRTRLDAVKMRDIDRYKRAKLKAGLSPKSINNHLTVLRKMLVVAVDWEVIETVPRIRWLRVPKPDFDFLDFEEAERLIAGASGQDRALIVTALKTGLRRGELMGLQWQDVDLVGARLRVQRSWVRGHLGTPKSGRNRTVPLSPEAVRTLKEHRHLKGEWVFCGDHGAPLTRDQIKHPLRRAYRKAGLRHMGWHMLRHTFASHLTMRAVPLKVVQELMGHATIEMTMRYAHLSPEVGQKAVHVLDLGRADGNIAATGGARCRNVAEL